MIESIIPFLAGICQGITRVSISYPFDVIKIHTQKMLTTPKQTFIKILQSDPFQLYRGISLSYISIGFERGIQYYWLEKLNKNNYNPFLSSFIISIACSIFTSPLQYITTNINIKSKYSFNNIYRGYFIEYLKNNIGSTIFIGSYYTLRNKYPKSNYKPYYGTISGCIVWLIIYPIDTIKTDYQTNINSTIMNVIKNRYKTYGILSFYRGITTMLIKTLPSATIGMYVYEIVKNKLSNYLIEK